MELIECPAAYGIKRYVSGLKVINCLGVSKGTYFNEVHHRKM